MTRVTMKSAIEKILTAHGLLEAFRANRHYSVKLVSAGYMPLAIEKHDKQITVTHYFTQNGDLVPDPNVEFVDLGGDDWLPVAIQHATGHYCRTAEQAESGNWLIAKSAMRDLQSFVRVWARNLLAQGFTNGKLERAEAG